MATNAKYSAFNNYYDDDDDDISAFFGYFEMHAGIVYDVARWIHFCGDLSLPLCISSDGFAPFTREFISLNPGLRIRLVFGNLG